MKEPLHIFKRFKRKAPLSFLWISFIFFGSLSVQSQQLADSLNWSVIRSGDLHLAGSQGFLYVGNVQYLGKPNPGRAFFLNGSSQPADNMPVFGYENSGCNFRNIYAAVADGNGGWYIGGDFSTVNGEKTGPLVHLQADKSIEDLFPKEISFGQTPIIKVLKKDGRFLYVGGSFSVTDNNGNGYQNIFRINLNSGKADPSFNPFPGKSQWNINSVDQIEVGNKQVFISGIFPGTSFHFMVLDKKTGKRVSSPSTKNINAFKLINDTLLVSTSSSFGYPAHGVVVLDSVTDTAILSASLPNGYTYYNTSVPDGRGGWYAGGPEGIVHLDKELHRDTLFTQKKLTSTLLMLPAGNALFVFNEHGVVINGKTYRQLFKLDARTGKIDTLFTPNPNGWVHALAVHGDTLFVGGTFSQIDGQNQPKLAALQISNGQLINWHPAVENCVNSYLDGIRALRIKDGFLYATGRFKLKNHPGISGITRFYLKNGLIDTTFYISGFDNACPDITDMAFYKNKLFIAGFFQLSVNGQNLNNLAWVNLDNDSIHTVNKNFKMETYYSHTPRLVVRNGTVYGWGMSLTDTSTWLSRPYFFSFSADSGTLTHWNPNPDDDVTTFSISGNRFFMSGPFTVLKTLFINNENATLFGWNTHNFSYIPFKIPGKRYNATPVTSMAVDSQYLFMAWSYSTYGDSTVEGIVRVNRKDLSFAPFHPHIRTSGFNTYVAISHLATGRSGLYVSGNFDEVAGTSRNGLCLLDPETGHLKDWHPPKFDGYASDVNGIYVSGDNVLATTKSNRLWPAMSRNGLARIDLTNGQLTSWNPEIKSEMNSYYPGDIHQLAVYHDTVVVSYRDPVILNSQDTGILFLINGITGEPVAGFNAPVCDADNWNGNKISFARQGDYLFVAGNFTQMNGTPHNLLAKIELKTGKVTTWNPPVSSGSAGSVAVFRDTVYLGGFGIFNKDDGKTYSLISINARTGKIIKAYSGGIYLISHMAVNQNGTLAVVNRDFNGNTKVFLLRPGQRDTLVEASKLNGLARNYTDIHSVKNLFLLAGKQMIEKGKTTPKTGIICYDPVNDTVFNQFSLPSSGLEQKIYSFALNDNILAAGGYLCNIYGRQNMNLAFLKMPDLHLKPGVTSWSPKKADNRNPFALMVYGTGFGKNTAVSLFNSDTAFSPDSIVVKPNKITAWFNGTRFSPGDWNLKVNISDTLAKTFAGAVKIDEGSYTDVWARLTGPNVVLIHKPETYYVSFGNKGNRAAFGVFLYIGVGNDQKVDFPDGTVRIPDIHYKNFAVNMDTVAMYSHVDYFFGQPFNGKVYALFIPYIPARFNYDLKISIRSDVHGQKPVMRVAISQPLYDSYGEMSENLKSTEGFFSSFFHCVYDVGSVVASLTPGISCIKSVFDNFIYEGYNRYVTHQTFDMLSVTKSTGLVALDCSGMGTVGKAYAVAAKIVQTGTGIQSISGSCDHFFKNLFQNNTESQVQASVDPNAKFGPTGLSASHFVTTRHPYQYLITFENDSSATAPAQRVRIIDTLDKNVFDLSTFRPLGFGFGDTNYLYRENDGDTVYIDLRPAKDALVRVFYRLNKENGILKWTFQTLDPNTYEYVTHVDDGFLPPNRKSPEGDGNVFYSIEPLAGLTEGTAIHNRAHIIFDWNDEMPTDTWSNTTDNTPPESAVNPLPDKTVETSFKVSWKGSDEGSGIYAYTVYVSENDSAYYTWLVDTHDTSAVFSGQPGVTYKFYSIAVDSAGNKEPVPSIYDARITVSGTGIETFGKGNQMQFRLYPNPAKGHLTVDYYLPQSSSVRIDLLNACGRMVQLPVKTTALRGTSHTSLDVSQLPAGYYFVRILTKYGVQVRKVVVR